VRRGGSRCSASSSSPTPERESDRLPSNPSDAFWVPDAADPTTGRPSFAGPLDLTPRSLPPPPLPFLQSRTALSLRCPPPHISVPRTHLPTADLRSFTQPRAFLRPVTSSPPSQSNVFSPCGLPNALPTIFPKLSLSFPSSLKFMWVRFGPTPSFPLAPLQTLRQRLCSAGPRSPPACEGQGLVLPSHEPLRPQRLCPRPTHLFGSTLC